MTFLLTIRISQLRPLTSLPPPPRPLTPSTTTTISIPTFTTSKTQSTLHPPLHLRIPLLLTIIIRQPSTSFFPPWSSPPPTALAIQFIQFHRFRLGIVRSPLLGFVGGCYPVALQTCWQGQILEVVGQFASLRRILIGSSTFR